MAKNQEFKQTTDYCKVNPSESLATAMAEWLDNRPYRSELLEILNENGIEYDDDAEAVADAIIDLIDRDGPVKGKMEEHMPDELVVRMAHYAGELEAKGKIGVADWDDLCVAISDVIRIYYDKPSETNPFHIEDVMDQVLRERFPADSKSVQCTDPVLKDVVALVCTHETRFGVDHYISLHPDSESALAAVDGVRVKADFDETNVDKEYFDYELDFHTLDISKLPDHREIESLSSKIDYAQNRVTTQQPPGQGISQTLPER